MNDLLKVVQHESSHLLLVNVGIVSLKFRTTSSQVISSRNLCKDGDFGFLLPNNKPRYLIVTMSPTFGLCLFKNSVVPGAAVKVIPFGLRLSIGVGGQCRALVC